MEAKFDNINAIIKELEKGYVLEIGIMGEQAAAVHKVRNEDDELVTPKEPLTNAYIGAVHEYGCMSRNIPQRSFLRMPIIVKLPEVLKKAQIYFVSMVKKGQLPRWLANVGMDLEDKISDAFHSKGFGSWDDLKPTTIRRRKKGKDYNRPLPLLDTGQLSASISSRVVQYED